MLITLIFWVQELRLLSPPVSCWFVLMSPLPLQDLSASSALWLQFCLSEPSTRPDLARGAVCVSAVAGAPRSHAAGMVDKDPVLLHCWHTESSLAGGSVRGKSNQRLRVCISVSDDFKEAIASSFCSQFKGFSSLLLHLGSAFQMLLS